MKKTKPKNLKQRNFSFKRLILKILWFSLISFVVFMAGMMLFLLLLAANGEQNLTRNDILVALWLDSLLLIGVMVAFIFLLRKKSFALIRWTRRAFVVLAGMVFLAAILAAFYLIASYENENFISVPQSGVAGTDGYVDGLVLQPQTLLEETNKQRTSNNITGLVLNEKLNASAQSKCQDMAAKDYWSHNDPAGTEPWHFLNENGYNYVAAGENLAYGFNSETATTTGWMNSKAHRNNLLSSEFTEVGFGICKSDNYIGEGKQIIVVQHLAKPQPVISTPRSQQQTSKPYVASVCTEVPIPYKTTTVYKTYMYEDEVQEWGGNNGYTLSCTADSTGFKPTDITVQPYDKEIWRGTKIRPIAPTP